MPVDANRPSRVSDLCALYPDRIAEILYDILFDTRTLSHIKGDVLCLRVAHNFIQVISRHGEGVAISIAELGAADLRVCHALIV